MPRHKIPGDRRIKDNASNPQIERNVVEMSGDGFDITTPDADQHIVAVTGGLSPGLTDPRQSNPYQGQAIWYTKAVSIPSLGSGFVDYSGAATNLEGDSSPIYGPETDLSAGTIVFNESGLYSCSWYMERSVDPGSHRIWFQLLTLHQDPLAYGNDNWFTVDKMRGGASPYWAGRANVTDWFVAGSDPNFSALYLKYNTGSGLTVPWALTSTQLTITKIL